MVGPFYLFSNNQFMSEANPIEGITTAFNIKMTNMNTSETYVFPLYTAQSPLFIQPMSENEFLERKYAIFTETKFFDFSQV